MQIIPRYKLNYSDNSLKDKQFKRRKIRKTNKILKRMDKEALMISVYKTNRHINLVVSDNNFNTLAKYSTLEYIDTRAKNNKNYCNIEYAKKLAKDSANKIKKLEKFNNKIVFNSGTYKYHGRVKTIDVVIKENINNKA